jgi:hypothetical protein
MHITLTAFAVFDNKVDAYGKPIYFKNVHEAKAELANAMQYDMSELNPIDYDLFELGTYSNQSGKHTVLPKPKHICNLRALATPKPEKETNPS